MVNHRKTAVVSIAKYYLINLLFLIFDKLILPLQAVNRKGISKQRKVENKMKIEGKADQNESCPLALFSKWSLYICFN